MLQKIGTAANRCGGFCVAVRYCCTHSADTPQVPTLPSLHGWAAIHSTVSKPSSSYGWLPGTFAAARAKKPRQSTTTNAYAIESNSGSELPVLNQVMRALSF